LTTLEKSWGQPVDIEFTAAIGSSGEVKLNLLQCRPLRLPRASSEPVEIPAKLDARNILFKSSRIMSGGVIDAIRYVIYIDPDAYARIETLDKKRSIGRVVGKLNEYFRDKEEKIIAVGPGRWGSNNIDLGVNVSYADIDNFLVLVEVGHATGGGEPELSYGTHFFQDLVEADIIYVPVFPDSEDTELNGRFFTHSPNALASILPEYAEYGDVIRVIDVPSSRPGVYAHVIADANNRKAICYLK
jgi:pyruvate, water dikinase